MSNYLYKGVNISNLIKSGGTSSPPGYGGFPTSTAPTYNTTGLDKPYFFSYLSSGVDARNYSVAYGIEYSGGSSGPVPTSIPSSPGYSFKHISGYCYGGGGGGGGGGGNSTAYGGGDGGTGGDGAFAAIISYPISGSVNYVAGNGGNGGSGNKVNDAGGNGNTGGSSSLTVGVTSILIANGARKRT
jgi:hypothetical protein